MVSVSIVIHRQLYRLGLCALQAEEAASALKTFNDRARNLLTILNCLSAVKKDYVSQKQELKKAVTCCVRL